MKFDVEKVVIKGEDVYVREMSVGERTRLFAQFKDDSAENMNWLCLFVLSDEQGRRLYTDNQYSQMCDAIPASAIGQITDAGIRLNGLAKADDPN